MSLYSYEIEVISWLSDSRGMHTKEAYSRGGNRSGATNNTHDMSHSDTQTEARNQDTERQDLDEAMEEGRSDDTHEYSPNWEEKEYRRAH